MEISDDFIAIQLLSIEELGGKFTYWKMNEKRINAIYKHPVGLKVGFVVFFGKYDMDVFAKNYKLSNTKQTSIDIIELEISSDKTWDLIHIKPGFYETYDFKALVGEFL